MTDFVLVHGAWHVAWCWRTILLRTFLDCTSPALSVIETARQRVRSEPGWQVIEIAAGHDSMISAPARLPDILEQAGRSS